jgi:hypothetical protein
MPTPNPRITVTLTPELHAVMRRLSELTGGSQSSIVAELLTTSLPVFERVIRVMEAARSEHAEMVTGIAANLADAQSRIEAQLGLALDDFDGATLPLVKEAEKVARRSRRRLSTPVPVTRGSGTPQGAPKGKGKGTRRGVGNGSV